MRKEKAQQENVEEAIQAQALSETYKCSSSHVIVMDNTAYLSKCFTETRIGNTIFIVNL